VSKNWNRTESQPDFFAMKEVIYSFLSSFGIKTDKIVLNRPNEKELPFMHPGATALLEIKGNPVGWMGEIHPGLAESFDLTSEFNPVVCELDLDYILLAAQVPLEINTDASKFPPVTRDIALLVDKKITHKEFKKSFADFNRRKHLKSTSLFDVYEGEKISEDKKSFAYTLTFQSNKKTLTDKEVDKEVSALIGFLETAVNAVQR
jgi:phenylalanyl-tRNA synthetase beta chain